MYLSGMLSITTILIVLSFILTLANADSYEESYTAVEISQLDRVTNLMSHTTRHECILHLTYPHANSKPAHIDFIIPSDHVQILGFLSATGTMQVAATETSQLATSVLPLKDQSHTPFHKIRIQLPASGASFSMIRLAWVLSGGAVPYPTHIPQGMEHRYMWSTFFQTPSFYKIQKQTHRILLASDSVKNTTSPSSGELTTFPGGLLYQTSKPSLPYTMQTMDSSDVWNVLYINNFPNILIEALHRKLTISHLHNSIQVEEHYDLSNVSPKLLHEFSRTDYGRSFYGGNSAHPLRSIHIHIPKDSYYVSYRDEVGNISTSHLRTEAWSEFLEVYTRFPLFGGWNCSFDVSYNVPLHHNVTLNVKTASPDSLYHLAMYPVFLFNDASVHKFTLEVVFPDGSDIKDIRLPFSIDQSYLATTMHQAQTVQWSYLDIFGRPCCILQRENLVQESLDYIHIEYSYSSMHMWAKLLVLIVFFFCVLLGLAFYARINFCVFPDALSSKRIKRMKQ